MDYDFNVKCLEETIKLEIARRKCYELFMNNCIKTRPNVYRCDRGQDSQDSDDWQNSDNMYIYISGQCRYSNIQFTQIFKYSLHSDI